MKMKKNPEKSGGRRGFLKSGLRTLFLGGTVFVCGLLGRREIRSAKVENICTIELPCRDCSEFTDCTDPKAAELKQDIPSQQ